MQPCSLLSLATALPPHVIKQDEAKALAREAFGGKPALFDRLSGVFDNAGIAKRHIVAPRDWYLESHGWSDRNAVYLAASRGPVRRSRDAAIESAGLKPCDIDGVVTVSTTGIATPSLGARVAGRVGFRYRCAPCSGFRTRLCGRGEWVSPSRRGSRSRIRAHMVVRDRRDLLDFDPARQRRSRRGGCDRAVPGDGAAAAVVTSRRA